ncbi:4-carboxymuconolactone decarboxylase [Tomitella gaofuii]|uniref:4-carboxymuconolactone decarboxylase n=1 Tax=Tomitella gaofuii TaxID=2760083 RepID=UPI0015FA3DC8|nr:4-carboxymuconolactone decarboxylase [Tomitella gaofuii]
MTQKQPQPQHHEPPVAGSAEDAARRDAGMSVRRAVLGDAHVDRARRNTTAFTADFQDFITRYAWGDVWTRPGLERGTRSVVTLTALLAHGHWDEFAMHVAAAVRNGLTEDEIAEVILQCGVYCGVPAANHGFQIAGRVLAELRDTGDRDAADGRHSADDEGED